MTKLLKNEFYKLLFKRSFVVILVVFTLYISFTNLIYKETGYNDIAYNETLDKKYYKDELAIIEKNPDEYDKDYYVEIKTIVEVIELAEQYQSSSWQYNIIHTHAESYLYPLNEAKYITNNQTELQQYQNKYNQFLQRIKNNDWKAFVQEELQSINEASYQLSQAINQSNNPSTKAQLEKELKSNQITAEYLQYRLDNNLPYGQDYLNTAINEIQSFSIANLEYDPENLNDDARKMYEANLREIEINKYILESKHDINDTTTSRSILISFYDEYSFLIFIIILTISGSIVSDEFNKGTIKTLLVKPYSRLKIIAAKYITATTCLILSILIIFILQIIIGGIFLDFASLSIPVPVFDYAEKTVLTMNVFQYFLNQTIAILPMFIILSSIAFTLSTLLKSSSLATGITVLIYAGSSIINVVAINKKVSFLKYFPTLHWDLRSYLYGGAPVFSSASLPLSITITIITLVAIVLIGFIAFKKTNIKNI